MSSPAVASVPASRIGCAGSTIDSAGDWVAVEEPLEMRIGGSAEQPGTPFAVVMRTPGDDFDLARGLTITEGLVSSPSDIASLHWGAPADFNAVEVHLVPGAAVPDLSQQRPWLSTASCGLCGKDSVDAIATVADPLPPGVVIDQAVLTGLPESLRAFQEVFDRTGGLHAAGAFRLDGSPVCVREDIGRHNAVDKVVGHLAVSGELPGTGARPGCNLAMVVSGRTGFEIVHKVAAARIPILASVSAPSSLAVELATVLGMTLAGFVRDGSATIYAGAERVI